MTNGTRVSLEELRQALTQLLDAVEQGHGPTVDLNADYYWTISPADAFRFDVDGAPEPTVGQLTDDIQSVRDMLEETQDAPMAVWHDLAHVIGILNRLAALGLPQAGNGDL